MSTETAPCADSSTAAESGSVAGTFSESKNEVVRYLEALRQLRMAKAKWIGVTFSAGGLVLALTVAPTFGTMLFWAGIVCMFVAIIL